MNPHTINFRGELRKIPGPSCSKLTMSLVNLSLKFWSSNRPICSHFFSKNICELDIVLTRTVNILTTNVLVKLMMLWRTRPCTFKLKKMPYWRYGKSFLFFHLTYKRFFSVDLTIYEETTFHVETALLAVWIHVLTLSHFSPKMPKSVIDKQTQIGCHRM